MKKTLAFFAALLLITAALLLGFENAAYDLNAYMELHAMTNAAENTGLDAEGLREASLCLIEYMQGGRDSIEICLPVYGEETRVFNDREAAHMRDVRKLFDLERTVRNTALCAGIACALIACICRASFRESMKAALWSFAAVGIVIGIIAVWAAIDFNSIFLFFHSIAFDNDLWLLDPRTDLMIRLLPEAFFSGIVGKAAVRMGGIFALLLAVCAVCAFCRRRDHHAL